MCDHCMTRFLEVDCDSFSLIYSALENLRNFEMKELNKEIDDLQDKLEDLIKRY